MSDDPNTQDSSQTEICINFPEEVSNLMVWDPIRINKFTLPMLELQILLIFFITTFSDILLKRLGFLKMTSEIIAGLVMSPRVVGAISAEIFTPPSEEVLSIAALYNYVLFLFLIGVKIDINIIYTTGRSAFITGFLGLSVPLFVGLKVVGQLVASFQLDDKMKLALINIVSTYAGTPFAGIVSVVSELQIVNSELGRLAMSIATSCEMFSISNFFFVYGVNTGFEHKDWVYCAVSIGGVVAYGVFVYYLVRPGAMWVIKHTPEGSQVSDKYIYAILATAGASSIYFYCIGQSIVIAPYLLGLGIPSGPPLGTTLERKLNTFVSGIFMPIYITTIAMKADFGDISLDTDLMKSAALVLAACSMSKFITYFLSALTCSLPPKDAFTLSLILSYRGVIEFACFNLGYELKLLGGDVFSLCIFAVFVTLGVQPILVKLLYDPSRKYAGYTKRDIVGLPPDAHLPILACIYKLENINPVIKIIDASAPSKEKRVDVHALFLMKLTGQSHPVFIYHRLDKEDLSNYPKSKQVIFSFKKFVRNNPSICDLHVYTSISAPKSMHEDICTLALTQRTSLIILPFHRTWTMEGFVQEDDFTLRSLNCSILHRAPCSVGILVDRGNLASRRSQKEPSIVMLFFGGRDDREGLALAKRMRQHPNVRISVVQFVCEQDKMSNLTWERILDFEELNELKKHWNGNGCIAYQEERVENGLELVDKMRSLIQLYNLFIVGRRYNQITKHTEGLELWSDFPELGVIGDMLISADFSGDHSVLVVQQQIQK